MVTRVVGLLVSVSVVAGLVLGAYRLGARDIAGDGGAEGLEVVEDAYRRISEQAVNPPDQEELVRGAVEGMVGTLDDTYAEYYDAGEYEALNAQLDGTIVGIGVVLDDTETGLVVQSVLPDSPAEGVDLRPRDRIVTVDGEDVRDLDSALAVDRVRGDEGTQVTLGVERDGRPPFEVTITRAEIRVPNVQTAELPGEVGYVQLRQFTDAAGDEVRDAVRELVDGGADALVLDLRGNPGGYLPAAVEVAGAFVADQEVVSVGADPDTAREYTTDADPIAPDLPLAVLVDEGSASASEIVAGALQDLGRAEIVGETTFGKGTVQTIAPLPGGSGGLKLTTARYYTPDGASIDGVGVRPDTEVASADGTPLGPEDPEEPQLAAARRVLADQLATAGGR
jgi:carboxyl-terminal processing protease